MTPDTMQSTAAGHRLGAPPRVPLPLARQLRILLVAGGLGAALVVTSIADVTWFDADARVSLEDLPTLPGLPPVPTLPPRPGTRGAPPVPALPSVPEARDPGRGAPPPLPPLPELPSLPPLPPLPKLPGGVR